jgi:hypothetical protein
MDNTNIQKPEPLNKSESQTKTSKFNFKSFLLYALLVFLGIIAARFVFSFLSSRLNPNPQSSRSPKSQGLVQLKKIMPAPTQARSPGISASKNSEPITAIKKKIIQSVNPYILNGVYFSGDKGYALINNQILEEGDTIGEATVEKISLESVELKIKDKTVRLTIRGK